MRQELFQSRASISPPIESSVRTFAVFYLTSDLTFFFQTRQRIYTDATIPNAIVTSCVKICVCGIVNVTPQTGLNCISETSLRKPRRTKVRLRQRPHEDPPPLCARFRAQQNHTNTSRPPISDVVLKISATLHPNLKNTPRSLAPGCLDQRRLLPLPQ